MFRLSRFVLFGCAVSAFAAIPPQTAMSGAKAALSRMPLRFEANQGQWKSGVRYAARGSGYTLLLGDSGPSLAFGAGRVDIGFLNSNPAPPVEAIDRLPARTDYFLGRSRDWRTGVANYSRVRYRAVYPGIDLVYYGNQNQLEYDFVLAPGADPRVIRMSFRGPAKLHLTADGDLALDVAGSRVLQKKPLVYQEGPSGREEIHGRYKLLGRNTVGVSVDRYDPTRPLVIDPVVYCTYIGSLGTEQIIGAKLGADGRFYMVGWTNTGEMNYIDGAYSAGSAGGIDIFVTVIDPNASYAPVYFSYLGGGGTDMPIGMDVDSSGCIYVTGTTNSSNFPTTAAAAQSSLASGMTSAFVVKLDPAIYGSDSLVYSSYLGGKDGKTSGNGIAAGSDGSIYVIGSTRASDFPRSETPYAAVRYGDQDAFITKIDPTASALLYSTYYGGEKEDDGRLIIQGPDGKVYFAVSTASKSLPRSWSGPEPYRSSPQGNADLILGVMDTSLAGEESLRYATFFGGSGYDEVKKMALDGNGNVLVAGYTLSPDFPVTLNSPQPGYGGSGDAFISIVNLADPQPDKFLVESSYLGGKSGDVAYDVAAGSDGSIYVVGYTLSTNFPVTGDAIQPTPGGGVNIFITQFQPGVFGMAAVKYSTYFGGGGYYVPTGFGLASDGTFYIGGYGTLGLPTSEASAQYGYAGGITDGFVLVLKK
jgi:hypothetical protein